MNHQKIALITDSCSELTPAQIAGRPIFVVPLRIHCSDGEFRDGVDIFPEDIYRRLKTELPKTSLPLPSDIQDTLTEIKRQGYEKVIAIMLSSGLSGTYNMMRLAGEAAEGLEVRCFDSLNGATGSGAMVLQTMEYVEQGVAWEELLRRVPKLIAGTRVFFSVDTLEYLQKGGRIGRVTAMAGSLMHIKPILTFEESGELGSAAKVRGTKQVQHKLVELVKQARGAGKRFNLLVANGGAEEAMVPLKEALMEELPDYVNLYETRIDATLSVYIGPGVLGSGIQILDEIEASVPVQNRG